MAPVAPPAAPALTLMYDPRDVPDDPAQRGGRRGRGGYGSDYESDDDRDFVYSKQYTVLLAESHPRARASALRCASSLIRQDLAAPFVTRNRTSVFFFGEGARVKDAWELVGHSARGVKVLGRLAEEAETEEAKRSLADADRGARRAASVLVGDDALPASATTTSAAAAEYSYSYRHLRGALEHALKSLNETGDAQQVKSADKRVFLFLTESEPCDADADQGGVKKAINQLTEELGANLWVVPVLSTPASFSWRYFGRLQVCYILEDMLAGQVVDELPNVPPVREMEGHFAEFDAIMKTRVLREASASLVLRAGEDDKQPVELAVRVSRPYSEIDPRKDDGRASAQTMDEVKATTTYRDEENLMEVPESFWELPRCFEYIKGSKAKGAEQVCMDRAAADALRKPRGCRNSPRGCTIDGLYVVGTKALGAVRDSHQMKPSKLVRADQSRDAAEFVALHRALEDARRVIVVRHEVAGRGEKPGELHALIPVRLPTFGFAMLRLPWLDDLRDDPPLVRGTTKPNATPARVTDACSEMVCALFCKEGENPTERVANPRMARKRRFVEAYALDEEVDLTSELADGTLPDLSFLRERGAEDKVAKFREAVEEAAARRPPGKN